MLDNVKVQPSNFRQNFEAFKGIQYSNSELYLLLALPPVRSQQLNSAFDNGLYQAASC